MLVAHNLLLIQFTVILFLRVFIQFLLHFIQILLLENFSADGTCGRPAKGNQTSSYHSQKGISNPALQFSVILEFPPSSQTLPTTLGSTLCGLCVGRRQGKQERQHGNHGYHNVRIKDIKDIMVCLSIF